MPSPTLCAWRASSRTSLCEDVLMRPLPPQRSQRLLLREAPINHSLLTLKSLHTLWHVILQNRMEIGIINPILSLGKWRPGEERGLSGVPQWASGRARPSPYRCGANLWCLVLHLGPDSGLPHSTVSSAVLSVGPALGAHSPPLHTVPSGAQLPQEVSSCEPGIMTRWGSGAGAVARVKLSISPSCTSAFQGSVLPPPTARVGCAMARCRCGPAARMQLAQALAATALVSHGRKKKHFSCFFFFFI